MAFYHYRDLNRRSLPPLLNYKRRMEHYSLYLLVKDMILVYVRRLVLSFTYVGHGTEYQAHFSGSWCLHQVRPKSLLWQAD